MLFAGIEQQSLVERQTGSSLKAELGLRQKWRMLNHRIALGTTVGTAAVAAYLL